MNPTHVVFEPYRQRESTRNGKPKMIDPLKNIHFDYNRENLSAIKMNPKKKQRGGALKKAFRKALNLEIEKPTEEDSVHFDGL